MKIKLNRFSIFLSILGLLVAVSFIPTSRSLAEFSTVDVSDPNTPYAVETYNDTVQLYSSAYPAYRDYTFFIGASGTLSLTLYMDNPTDRIFTNYKIIDAYGNYLDSGYSWPLRDWDGTNPILVNRPLEPGQYTVRVIQDARGFFWPTGFPPISYTLTLSHPQSAPVVEITAPAYTAAVSHRVALGVREKAIPGNSTISWVDFLVDGAYIGTASERPFELNWRTDLYSNGNHSIEYRAYDGLGRYTPKITQVKVSNTASDTVTESFFGRLYALYSYHEYYFAMTRLGYADLTLSGENVDQAYFRIFDEQGNFIARSQDWYENPKKKGVWLKEGNYVVWVYKLWRGKGPYVGYVLTIDHPGKREMVSGVSITPEVFDPSGDNEGNSLEKTNISYTLAGSADVTIEVRDSGEHLARSILSGTSQEAGTNNISWDGLDSEENIAEEGMYKVAAKIKDASGNEIDSAWVEVEVKYHLGH